jgi:hypothetical protein
VLAALSGSRCSEIAEKHKIFDCAELAETAFVSLSLNLIALLSIFSINPSKNNFADIFAN